MKNVQHVLQTLCRLNIGKKFLLFRLDLNSFEDLTQAAVQQWCNKFLETSFANIAMFVTPSREVVRASLHLIICFIFPYLKWL